MALHRIRFISWSGIRSGSEKSRLADTADVAETAGFLAVIETVGVLTGATDAAAALVGSMRASADAIEVRVADPPRVRCFFEVYYPPLKIGRAHV